MPYPSVKHLNSNIKKALKTRKERYVFLKAFNTHAAEHGHKADYDEVESFKTGYRAARAHRESKGVNKMSELGYFIALGEGVLKGNFELETPKDKHGNAVVYSAPGVHITQLGGQHPNRGDHIVTLGAGKKQRHYIVGKDEHGEYTHYGV